MKTLDLKTFEKLKIRPVNPNNLNDSNVTITKSELKTFDIVRIKGKLFMVFRNNDAKKYFQYFKLCRPNLYEDVFVRTIVTTGLTAPVIELFKNYNKDLKYWINNYNENDILDVWIFKDEVFDEYNKSLDMIDLTQAAFEHYLKKYKYNHIEINRSINEKAFKTGGAKITNDVDDASKYKTVKEITSVTATHCVSTYNDSDKLLDVLTECNLLEKGNGMGGTLYKNGWNGVLYYWLKFKDMSTLCRFLVEFNNIYESFTYDDPKDGKWRMCFDTHDDPLTGTEDNSVTYLLRYFSKTSKLEEIDKAVDDLCFELLKKYTSK